MAVSVECIGRYADWKREAFGEAVMRGRSLISARRSRSLLMVGRLEIGRKLEGRLGSRFGFLSNGVICAVLKDEGNLPCMKERLAIS